MPLDPSTSSISTPINIIPSEHRLRVDYMGSALFKAAQEGDIEPFNKYQGDLHCLVDGRQNTALHIYFRIGGQQANKNEREFCSAFRNKEKGRDLSNDFIKQLVDKCSALLVQPNESGEIPLHIAARQGRSDIIKFLIELAEEVRQENLEKGLEATTSKQMLRMRDKDGNTAMHKAVESGELDVVRLLVKELDPDFSFSANKSGETPLHIAAKTNREHLVAEILKYCKSTEYGGPDGSTDLHTAVMVCSDVSIEKLIEANKHLTKKTDDNGRTPLHCAALYGFRRMVKLLLESDASAAYITDKERGMTALHMAAWRGKKCIMKDIISHCPGCCEIVDKRGWNFLHFAVLTLIPMHLERFLLALGDEKDLLIRYLVNEKDVNGNTPFHLLTFGHLYIEQARGGRRHHQVVNFLHRITNEYDYGYMYRNSDTKKEQQIQQLLEDILNDAEVAGLPISRNFCVIVEIPEEKNKKGKQDIAKLEIEEKAQESHLLVATLVATVTFTAAFTVPGGYNEQQGTATLTRDSAFKAFVLTNTMAFVASLLAIFLHFFSLMFRMQIRGCLRELIHIADHLTIFAMAAMVVAFSTGTYAVLQSSSRFAIVALFFGLIFFPVPVFLYLLWALINLLDAVPMIIF